MCSAVVKPTGIREKSVELVMGNGERLCRKKAFEKGGFEAESGRAKELWTVRVENRWRKTMLHAGVGKRVEVERLVQ